MKSPPSGNEGADTRFTCPFPGCQASYRRKAHLRRHQEQHVPKEPLICPVCGKAFGRGDTLRRHVRKGHHIMEPGRRPRRACANCRAMKLRCEGGSPCNECRGRSIDCVYDTQEESSRHSSRSSSPEVSNRGSQAQYIGLYFERFHPHWPFIHKASFDPENETSLLKQAMMVIGLWLTESPVAQSAAIDLHGLLDRALRSQRDRWDVSRVDELCSSCEWPIAMYQAILLHVIFAVMHRHQSPLGPDLKPSLPSTELELLDALVGSCRRLGMLSLPNILALYHPETGPESFRWVCVEEVKRFNIALFKTCKAVSCAGPQDRGADYERQAIMTPEDLEFPVPTNEPLWRALTKGEWEIAAINENFDNLSAFASPHRWISQSPDLLNALL